MPTLTGSTWTAPTASRCSATASKMGFDALNCPVGKISVKATTTDGLGALGRGEGVLATASVLLSLSE
ncbi:MAG: 2-C-methyl-D-erythritol 2,4-cyclodiphosphate synthase [Chloroflexi bacterium]|nr:MAG: 2-C-methyl-D-erythritol 2,4-cyclodiphosphate synthase [Chloroflexota bacterium]